MSLLKKGFFKVGFFAYIQTIKTQKIREKKKSLILQFAMNFKLKYLFQINYYFKSITMYTISNQLLYYRSFNKC